MIITPAVQHHAPAQMVDFYKKHFNNVHVIHCDKKTGGCGNSIALELSQPHGNDNLGLQSNPLGIIVLPVDDKLLSSRVRLDGMMGYQCICGNDTRASEIEEKHSPLGDFHPHEVAAIHDEFQRTGWQPPVKVKDGREHRASFIVERL